MSSNAYTIAEIDHAVNAAMMAVSKFPEGQISPATVQLLIELYLGSLDNPKKSERAMSAGENK